MIDRRDDLARRLAGLTPEKRELLLRQLRRQSAAPASGDAPPGRCAASSDHEPSQVPATPEQEQIWLVDQLNPGSPAFVISFALRMKGPLDRVALERAFEEIVRRHEALRTTFRAGDDGRPVQVVSPEATLRLDVESVERVPEGERAQQAERTVVAGLRRPMDLAAGPLLRVVLVRVGPAEHLLAVATHHIVSDGWSLGVMHRELDALYRAFSRGCPSPLPEPVTQYRAHVQRQRERSTGPSFDAALAFWKQQLAQPPPALTLPADRSRPPHRSYAGTRCVLDLSSELTSEIRALSRRQGVTPFITLLAAFYTLLRRLSGQTDILFGTPVSGRDYPGTEDGVGLYANTLILRLHPDGDPSFMELLADVRRAALDAFAHPDVPLIKVVEVARPDRETTYTPFVQVLFTQPPPIAPLRIGDLEVEPFHVDPGTAQFDLMLLVLEGVDALSIAIEGSADLFDPHTVERISAAYRRTLDTAIGDPHARLSAFPPDETLARRAAPGKEAAPRPTIALASTFAAEPVLDVVAFWMRTLGRTVNVQSAPLDQIFQQLLDPDGLLAGNTDGINIVLLRPFDLARVNDRIDEAIQALVAALRQSIRRTGTPHIVCICPDSPVPSASEPTPQSIGDMEARLAAEVGEVAGAYLITTRELDTMYPESARDATVGHPGGLPFGPLAVAGIGTMVARRINALRQEPSKVVVVDCDGTLWNGICGEDGPGGVRIDPARRRLQESLVELASSGVLVCLCSRNNEEDVVATFDANPGMPLRRTHLVASRINWHPKSENLRSLAAELHLGLRSFVFLDDDPAECAEVRAGCPEVLTIQLPGEPEQIARVLNAVWPLDRAKITGEDKARTDSYRSQAMREQLRESGPTLRAFLEQLQLKVEIRPLEHAEIPRASQLSLRTNQFNLTTIRRTESEIAQLAASPRHQCLGVHVTDRFGDYGLVGLAITTEDPPRLEVDTFLLSCRVLGRGVEHRVLRDLIEHARSRRLERVGLRAVPTPTNTPARAFLMSVGGPHLREADSALLCDLPADFAVPEQAELISQEPGGEATRPQAVEGPARSEDGGDPEDRPDRDVWSRIATELSTAQQIQAAVERERPWQSRSGSPRPYVAPKTDTERLVAGIWREALHVDLIGLDDNFFDLGGHSLLAVQVVSRIRAACGVELPLRRLFESPTVRATADAVDGASSAASAGGDEVSDRLEADARLDAVFEVPASRSPNMRNPRSILLTGAGGFLGGHLLRELLQQTDAEIFCLMRASSRESAFGRIARNLSACGLEPALMATRVVPVLGDLSHRFLGLSGGAFDELAGRIDAIYHAAAEVNFLHPYDVLRSVNVGGTLELLKLAARTTVKAFHHVSTLGVLGLGQGEAGAWPEADAPERYEGPEVGYFQSKWVAERLVVQARNRGLPATIYRPSMVAGDRWTGTGSSTDMLGSMFRTLIEMGVAPDSDDPLDIVPVGYVAAAMVRLSMRPDPSASVFHLANPDPARFSDVIRWIGEAGHPLRLVSPAEWISALNTMTARRSASAALAAPPDLARAMVMELAHLAPGAGGAGSAPRYDCRRALAALTGTGIACPPVDASLVAACLPRWIAPAEASPAR